MWRKGLLLLIVVLLGWAGLSAQAAQAQNVVWTAQFFNNAVLSDPAVVTRTDPAISFNWGNGSPAAGVNADYFSARWGAYVYFDAGTYRFYAQADDGVGVKIDDAYVAIDTLDKPRVGQLLTGDLTLTAGYHKVQVDYQEFAGDAYVYVTWANLATNPNPPVFTNPQQPTGNGPWIAQYYPNATLSGNPILIQSEVNPTRNWGSGSPLPSIPADNFSVRWTSTQTFTAGTYRLDVQADDGVRVVVDGVTVISEFHSATGLVYSATLNLSAGQHTFLIEYYEAFGDAFITYNFTPVSTQPSPTGATATVTGAYRLNVRNSPFATGSTVLTKINRNETYSVVGRNANSSWWQINVNGIIGWVSGRYVTVVNAQNVPDTSGTPNPTQPTPQPTGQPVLTCPGAPLSRLKVAGLGRVTPGVSNNVRSAPGTSNALVGRIPSGASFSVLAGPQCVGNMAWWQVNYNGLIGWTAEGFGSDYWLEPAQ